MRVVLPEPLGPTRARACPAGTRPLTPVSTVEAGLALGLDIDAIIDHVRACGADTNAKEDS